MSIQRDRSKAAAAAELSAPPGHNLPYPVDIVPITSLKFAEGPRTFTARDETVAGRIVRQFGLQMPAVIGDDNVVLIGELMIRAAKKIGVEEVPVIRSASMSAVRQKALSVAYNRMLELGRWDKDMLRAAVLEFEVEITDFELEDLGFETAELDLLIVEPDDEEEVTPPLEEVAVSQVGDIWQLGDHRVICGDAQLTETYTVLMGSPAMKIGMVVTDPPFGCPIDGFVASEGRHREFVMGSGEMSDDELRMFFRSFLTALLPFLGRGAVVEIFIDWRSLHLLLDAATPILGKLLNLAVWTKDRAGMGSFLRSQHELVLIFKAPGGRHRNNVELGRHGRDRSNVWRYPSAKTASKGSDEGDMLAHHPTPKSVRMIADAILDCTKRGDIVLDPFLGSGTTLIAAEKVGRRCFGSELDPLYVDLIIRRFEAWSGRQAVHAETGLTFAELAERRAAA